MNQERLGYLLMAIGAALVIAAFWKRSLSLGIAGGACVMAGWYLARRARRDAGLDDAAGIFDDLTDIDIDLD